MTVEKMPDFKDYGCNNGFNEVAIQRLTQGMIRDDLTRDINSLLEQLSPNCPRHCSNSLIRLLENRDLLTLIVIDRKKNKVIGMGSAIFHLTLSDMSVSIEGVVIDKDYRRKDFGRALVENLIKRIKGRNDFVDVGQKATHINLTSHPTREAANKLYQKLGFKKRDTNMYRLSL